MLGSRALLSLGRHGPREQTAAGAGRRQPHARAGAALCPPRRAGVGACLYPAVAGRWVSGVSDGFTDTLWPLGAASKQPGQGASAQALLVAPAPAALRPGHQDRPSATLGPGEQPRRVWNAGCRPARAGPTGLAAQYRLRGAPQPGPLSAVTVGRRVITLCKSEDRVQQQLALFQAYHNFCLPHASVRRPLSQTEPTNGTGSAKTWCPRTPAMTVGLTNRLWSLREVLLFRVPPWMQLQAL